MKNGKIYMKNELKDRFKSEILLNQFDLSEQDLSDEWLSGFFTNPVSRSLKILDENNNWITKDLYIGFSVIKMETNSKKLNDDFYLNLNKKIKENILNEWGSLSKNPPVYKIINLKSSEDEVKKFLYIYLSPKKSNQLFDFNVVSNKESIVASVFDMLMAAYLIERINKRNPLNIDFCGGKIFLNPLIDDEDKTVRVFEYYFKIEDFKLRFILKHQVYSIKNISVDKYDDVCLLNNYRYEDKLDAREYTRSFLDFISLQDLKETKFITQVELYKDVLGMLNCFGIVYKETTFKPEYLFNQFPSIEAKINDIIVYISSDDKKAYEDYLVLKNIPHDFNRVVNHIKSHFNLNVSFIENPSLEIILKNKHIPCIYLMFGDEYKEKYVSFKCDNGELKKLSDVATSFLEKKLYQLDYSSFIKQISSYDVYSQVKLYNLYANCNELEPVISQGIILGVKNFFERSLNSTTPLRPNKRTGKIPTYPSKETVCKFEKVITELDIKKQLYLDKVFNFKTKFPGFENIDIVNVKIINILANKKGRLYSFVNLDKGLNDDFKVTKNKILVNDQINELLLSINWKQELNLSDCLILINDNYLLRVKDNDFMPFLIMEKNRFNVEDKDICFKIEEAVLANKSKNKCSIKSTKDNQNYFFPYNLPTVGTMIGKENLININNSLGYSNCIFNMNGNEIQFFMTLRDQPLSSRVPKNNRLECINLFSLNDFIYQKVDWKDNEQLLYFYLSSISFNYMLAGGITKKSLLTKLGDVVLLN